MNSIDSFINIPIIISAILLIALFIFLIIVRYRNTAKTSFVFYTAFGILFAGHIYMLKTSYSIYLVCAVLVAELLLLPYLIIISFGLPKPRVKKSKRNKKLVNRDEIIDSVNQSLKKAIELNNEFSSKASELFTSENTMLDFLEYFNNRITKETRADGCAILLYDDFDAFLTVRSLQGVFPPPYKLPETLPRKQVSVESNFKYSQFQLSDSIFGNVVTSKEAIFIHDAQKSNQVYKNGSEDFLFANSYIFVPIVSNDGVLGVVAVSRNKDSEKFYEDDFDNAKLLTEAASTAMRSIFSFLSYSEYRKLYEESGITSKFQKKIIPEKTPSLAGISLGAWSKQNENICSDYYDFVFASKTRATFIMADVAGKGMNALSIMIMIRTMFRLVASSPQNTSSILRLVNRGLNMESEISDHFASVSIINYNPITKEAQISSGGINPVFIYSAQSNTISNVTKQNEPLGVEKESIYQDLNIKLQSGDIIATCTDGLLESLDESGVQYSIENLTKAIVANSQLSGKEIAEHIKEDIKKYCGSAQQYDDQSILIIKIQ